MQDFIDTLNQTNPPVSVNPLVLLRLLRECLLLIILLVCGWLLRLNDEISKSHLVQNRLEISVEFLHGRGDKVREQVISVRQLPDFHLLLERFHILLFLVLLARGKLNVILFQRGWHVRENSRQVRINLSLQVRDEDRVHFLKEFAAHVLSFLLQSFQVKISFYAGALADS